MPCPCGSPASFVVTDMAGYGEEFCIDCIPNRISIAVMQIRRERLFLSSDKNTPKIPPSGVLK